jgi:hypothetical protein
MSVKFNRTKRFIELQKLWYSKLTQSGFSDLEHLDQKNGLGEYSPYLKKPLQKFNHLHPSDVSERLEYFSAAQDFSSDHDFPTILHKFIWDQYVSGVSYRNMVPIIEQNRFKSVSIFWISTEIAKLKQSFTAWQVLQDDAAETLEDFMQSNSAID